MISSPDVRVEVTAEVWDKLPRKAAMVADRDGAEVNRGIADWGFSGVELQAIERENALDMLPRMKSP